MHSFLVVMDGTPESRAALRFAVRQAARIHARVIVLVFIEPIEFLPFGGVQAALAADAQADAEARIAEAAEGLPGAVPTVILPTSDQSIAQIRQTLADHPEIIAMVLGASPSGTAGPLVSHFSAGAGQLPCLLLIVPGNYDDSRLTVPSVGNAMGGKTMGE